MFDTLVKWGGFVKFSHTVFALPFALAAMVVAARDTRGWPGWKTFLLILAAMTSARTCAMAFNRIVDRKFDAMNPRTAMRELPAGKLGVAEASAAVAVAAVVFGIGSCTTSSRGKTYVLCRYRTVKPASSAEIVRFGLSVGRSIR